MMDKAIENFHALSVSLFPACKNFSYRPSVLYCNIFAYLAFGIDCLNAISTSYYTLSVPYCVYCSRPSSTKRPRASAVNKAIQQRERVVSGLSQNSHLEKYAVRLNSSTSLLLISIFPVILFLFQENGLS